MPTPSTIPPMNEPTSNPGLQGDSGVGVGVVVTVVTTSLVSVAADDDDDVSVVMVDVFIVVLGDVEFESVVGSVISAHITQTDRQTVYTDTHN